MIDMELALAWKTQQGYADCSTSLAEHDKQVRADAIFEIKNIIANYHAHIEDDAMADIFSDLEQLKESKEWV